MGGPGAIHEFRGGVYVDAEGVLRRKLREDRSSTNLASARVKALEASENTDVQPSTDSAMSPPNAPSK